MCVCVWFGGQRNAPTTKTLNEWWGTAAREEALWCVLATPTGGSCTPSRGDEENVESGTMGVQQLLRAVTEAMECDPHHQPQLGDWGQELRGLYSKPRLVTHFLRHEMEEQGVLSPSVEHLQLVRALRRVAATVEQYRGDCLPTLREASQQMRHRFWSLLASVVSSSLAQSTLPLDCFPSEEALAPFLGVSVPHLRRALSAIQHWWCVQRARIHRQQQYQRWLQQHTSSLVLSRYQRGMVVQLQAWWRGVRERRGEIWWRRRFATLQLERRKRRHFERWSRHRKDRVVEVRNLRAVETAVLLEGQHIAQSIEVCPCHRHHHCLGGGWYPHPRLSSSAPHHVYIYICVCVCMYPNPCTYACVRAFLTVSLPECLCVSLLLHLSLPFCLSLPISVSLFLFFVSFSPSVSRSLLYCLC